MTTELDEAALSQEELTEMAADAARYLAAMFPKLQAFDVSLRFRPGACVVRASYSFGDSVFSLFSDELTHPVDQRKLLTCFVGLQTRLRSSSEGALRS